MKDIIKVYETAYYTEVTGSKNYLVCERPDGRVYRILLDCGYFQEIKYRYLNYVDEIDPQKIDAIIITHNHIDHTGLLPKLVRQGFRGKIYMTNFTQELIGGFLKDSADQQEENASEMRERYPNEAKKFQPLYFEEDVEKTLKLCEGIAYRKTIEIFPGVKLTFWENGHILGAGIPLIQFSYPKMKPLNFVFTGDLKLTNCFYRVPMFPKWFREMELIMFCESTYGSTRREEIKKCFKNNILEAFRRKQNILIGGFAQGRMQEILYDFRLMQDEGLIPEEYRICIDGPLGIDTTFKYQSILSRFSPAHADFIPKGTTIVEPKRRENILSDGVPTILITTSGMLSNGPARIYVPIFLEHKNSLIHLVGYAAEGTLARKLLETKRDEVVKIGNKIYQKNAVVKTTREKTSHSTQDELLEFVNMFTNVKFLGINHGETSVKEIFKEAVLEECPHVEKVQIMDRDHMVGFYRVGLKNELDSRLEIKAMPSKLLNNSVVVFGKEKTFYQKKDKKMKISTKPKRKAKTKTKIKTKKKGKKKTRK